MQPLLIVKVTKDLWPIERPDQFPCSECLTQALFSDSPAKYNGIQTVMKLHDRKGMYKGNTNFDRVLCTVLNTSLLQNVSVAFAAKKKAYITPPSFISLLMYQYAAALLYMGSDIQYSNATETPHNLPCTCV